MSVNMIKSATTDSQRKALLISLGLYLKEHRAMANRHYFRTGALPLTYANAYEAHRRLLASS